ncbi:MAG: gamma-glutamyltransferase [Armatimonadetes bacterium]|jgi:gamma-glutamyltranspeptidase/glutathione hydrolase|nr:gamma-glutamyltransferase [Armatimonadota bacterium]GBC90187.1 Putative gamma-glutamyltransferase YwrD [bacterium HR14]GIV12161.1 MAG: gamma-glutamyltransferase [Fimbriimonadales bacterium]CUU04684.1 gamma-glutamyltranspeptidase / glutathione hydrolase [Armatimonadetes bacterium GBS]
MLSRSAVAAARGIVASSQPLAVSAGLQMLQAGGSFVDAAIATSAVLCVVEPWASHLGGDAFVVLYDARQRKTVALNGSGAAPARANPDAFPNGIPLRGLSAATVPGLVDAWFRLHALYGRLPIAKLLEPAITYARDGYPISPRKAQIWRNASRDRVLRTVLPALLHQTRPPQAGEKVRCPDLARTLQAIASGGRDAFYKGEIAQKMVNFSKQNGGLFEREDFEAHQSELREPLRIGYRGYTVHGQPPVSQGIILMEALGILDGVPLKEISPADRTHWMVEAIKCAFADRWRYLGDPRFVPDRTAELLSPEFLARRREAIQPTRAQEIPSPGTLRETNTTYFCVADEEGNAISFIQSVYHPFGCGVVIEGTGILMNNRMCGFSLEADSPNRLEPRKRPMHTLNAYLITKGDALAYVGGTPGGDIQVQSNLQIISQLIDFELDPQQAIEKPRWAWQPLKSTDPSPGRLSVETLPNDPESQALVEELRKRGHAVNATPLGTHPSAVQVIQKLGESYLAGSDPRTEGLAGGY